jgi:lipopolysaccharide O-acetyltransferase
MRKFFVRLVKRWLFGPPSDMKAGVNVFIWRPRKIEGAENIVVASDVAIASNAWIATYSNYYRHRYSPTLRIGQGTQIGRYSCITCINLIDIGRDCLFSEHVYISDHAHGITPDVEPMAHQALHSKGPVIIGNSCFIGYRAVVLPGVTLGNNCVVGANSVVTRSFPAYSMIAGAPAKLIKTYSQSAKQWIDA